MAIPVGANAEQISDCRFADHPLSASLKPRRPRGSSQGKPMSWIEMNMKRPLFASRWLMEPFYVVWRFRLRFSSRPS
jgi:hypothetical protein